MLKLFKFLKPYYSAVIVILGFLIIQAYCDLSLPTYTSDVVNVGIQQGGIAEKLPESISTNDYNNWILFLNEDESNIVADIYTLNSNDSNNKEVYELTDKYINEGRENKPSNEYIQISKDLSLSMMLVTGFSSKSEFTNEIENNLKLEMSKYMDVEDLTIFDMVKQMPEQARLDFINTMHEQMSEMPESIIEQASSGFIQMAYTNLNIDLDERQTEYILIIGAKMLGLALVGMIASIIVGYISSVVAARVGRGLRKDVFTKVVGFSNGEFDKFSTASLITRSTNDIQQIMMLSVMMLRVVIYAPIMAIGGIWKVLSTNVNMSWIIALGVGLVLMVVATLFIVVMPKFKVLQNIVDKLNLVSREILTGLSVIRAFSTEKYEEDRFDKVNRQLTRTNLFVNRSMTFMMPLMMLIMNGISVLIIWSGGKSVENGSMQVGDLMAFIQYTMQIIMAFLMICMISVMMPRAAVSATRIDEVIKSKTAINDPEKPKQFSSNSKGLLEFNHVSFKYPEAEDYVLNDINFTASPGKTTAIIGSTGCGKTTLVNLIPRFYDVSEGEIKIDGINIKDIKQHDLRDVLGYVPQKGILFSGDIKSNIMYGNNSGNDNEMMEAAEVAQATDFINDKPDKYESHIAQGGANVSGGQKQRLAIARAIAKNPNIFIFDDSFSALDYKTDVKVRSELKKKTQDSTVLIVAQRISTILHADQIIVLDDGKIVGIGTHRELLNNCEAYYEIASSQLSEKELEEDMKGVN